MMKISRGRKITILVIVIACATIVGYVLWRHQPTSKSAVISYVQDHKSDLELYIENIDTCTGGNDVYNDWAVSCYPNSGMVEFLVSTGGFGSSGKYSGFYYSPNDVPIGYQAQALDFQEHASGWQWDEPDGDNHYYTEKITTNWYWFEMNF